MLRSAQHDIMAGQTESMEAKSIRAVALSVWRREDRRMPGHDPVLATGVNGKLLAIARHRVRGVIHVLASLNIILDSGVLASVEGFDSGHRSP